MGKIHLVNLARIAAILGAAAVLMPSTAAAGGHRRRGCADVPADVQPAAATFVPPLGAFP